MQRLQVNTFLKRTGTTIYPRLLLTGFFLSAFLFQAGAQYPYIIEMMQMMIGNATVVAKQEVIHKPGFWAKTGLDYNAYIDPSFNGTGTNYDPPPDPGNLVVSPSDMNYIITTTPRIEGFLPGNSYNCSQVSVDITYFDGLGRQLQDVSVMGGPGQKDIIKPYSYDFADRPDSAFLPYNSANGQNGQFDPDYAANQKNFIASIYGQSNKDYGLSNPFYEESPLNRILKQSAPGADWAFKPQSPGDEHVAEMDYSVNGSSVSGWKMNNNSFSAISYASGELFINIVRNENKGINQSVTKEYKNKTGQVILIENQNGSSWYQTHYIYDDFGLLRCVVPPKASTPVNNPALCYYYQYDNRHRMVTKKLPGADSVLMIYDKRDRLVMTQDGKMRAENPKQWLLNCYDEFDRPVMTGLYIHSSSLTRTQMQEHYNNNVTVLNESINGNYNNTDHGYTRNVFSALCSSGCTYDVLSINYYNDYDFAGNTHLFDNTNGIVNQTEVIIRPRNVLTGTKVRVLNNDTFLRDWIVRAFYYDNKYRVIQTVADNQCEDGRDVLTNKFSFDGGLDSLKTVHTAFNNTTEYIEGFVYDHRGRLLEHTLDGLSGLTVMLASMHYDPAGQLARKQIHSEIVNGNHSPFIQKTDYLYNIRGWLTSVNDPGNTAGENDIFALKLSYNNEVTPVTVQHQYNGNISAMEWATNRTDEKFAYRFLYDNMNRISYSEFYLDENSGYIRGPYDEKNLTYDANGNILTLDRYASEGTLIDQLTYNYLNNGNQLNYVQDAAGDVSGVIDYPGGTATTPGFAYDKNGNMIKSHDKGMNDTIRYNFLNMPGLLDFGSGEKIRYLYDAAGNKLAKIVIYLDALPESSLIYAGNFVYDWNGNLQYIQTGEGRLIPDNKTYRFEYFMKDHLGNTRAVYAQAAPGLPQVAEYNHYYPFGMQLEALSWSSDIDIPNNYLYNGKELQPEYDLQWYDYGARFYDPELGRWHSQDPLAEKHFNYTPYAYVFNNPITLIDPLGLDSIYVLDQAQRPTDNGTKGESYTADIYIVQNKEIKGPYNGSSYPNSKSNTDNSTNSNTVKEGDYQYNNEYGHNAKTEKGLNLIDENGNRNTEGMDSEGNDITMTDVNVHEGESDNGNYNSRGSLGCITVKPADASTFFSNFDWSGATGNSGKSTGTIFIQRGNTAESMKNQLKNKQEYQCNPIRKIQLLPIQLIR